MSVFANTSLASPTLLRILLLLLSCLLQPIAHAQLDPSLNKLSIALPSAAQEAVNNGVKLTLDCNFAKVNYLLFLPIARDVKKHQFTIARHALSNRYIVKKDNINTPHMFRSIHEAIDFIGAQALRLLESHSSKQPSNKMRISLNKYKLPGPMRLGAFIGSNWTLDTGWVTYGNSKIN